MRTYHPPVATGEPVHLHNDRRTSHYLITELMLDRKHVAGRLEFLLSHASTVHSGMPRLLTTDNAKEYQSNDANYVYRKQNIEHFPAIPYSPQQNGIVERINLKIMNALATLHYSKQQQQH